MEKSSNSNTMKKSPRQYYDDNNHEYSEESGWTMYFEDFLLQTNNDQSDYCNSFGYESSLISDAGSSAKNLDNSTDQRHVDRRFGVNFDRGYFCNKRLSFKKRKIIIDDFVDDALEDTASSPVNSPKVFDNLSQMGMKPKEKEDDHVDRFEDKGINNYCGKKDDQNMSYKKLDTRRESDYTELKKRGLCLVPLSLFANYIG